MDRRILIGFLDVLIEEGVPLDTYRRDVEIRDKYFSTIATNPNINRTNLKQELAEEFHISYKSIEAILYGYKGKLNHGK